MTSLCSSCDEKRTIGMFGGKFLPMHVGHKMVLIKAFLDCDVVYLCLFMNSPEERGVTKEWYTHPDFRYYQLKKTAGNIAKFVKFYKRNVEYHILVVDCSIYEKDGKEDWDAEADYLKGKIGRIDRVYSSEPDYDPIFRRIYPESKHIIVDADRNKVPISATDIRSMTDLDEQVRWMV